VVTFPLNFKHNRQSVSVLPILAIRLSEYAQSGLRKFPGIFIFPNIEVIIVKGRNSPIKPIQGIASWFAFIQLNHEVK